MTGKTAAPFVAFEGGAFNGVPANSKCLCPNVAMRSCLSALGGGAARYAL